MPGYTLYTWGAIPFETYPLNVHEMQHVTETDWARKEIVGAAIHHEWVGENEEEIHLRGRVFPQFFVQKGRRGQGDNRTSGGLGHLDVMDNMRRLAQVHVLARGDGWHLGWFAIQKLTRNSTVIGNDGIGKQIEFEVVFTRMPIPSDPNAYFPNFWGQVG
jgi:phage protein U